MGNYQNQSYYDILGVEQTASIINIQKAKDRLKFGGPDDRAPFSMWDKIDEAYNVLSNPEKRIEYDKKLEDDKNIYSNSNHVTNSSSDNSSEGANLPSEESEDEKEDIYSSSDHKIHSIFETAKDSLEDTLTLPKLKRAGKNLVLAVPTAVLATITIVKELNKRKKYALTEETIGKTISEVKTPESELIEEYRKKLHENIDRLLEERHNNYSLEIDRLRYENNIELLKKRIEMKENSVVKKGALIKYKLQLTALRKQLETFKISLEKVNKKIRENGKKQKLLKIHDDLIKVNEQIKENSKKTIALKKLEIKKEDLLDKKKLKIQRMKSNREFYAIFKDSFLSAHDITENFVDNVFTPADKINYETKEITR